MIIKSIDSQLIIKKFALNGYNIHPNAVDLIKKAGIDIDRIVDEVCKRADGCFIITPDDVIRILNEIKNRAETPLPKSKVKESDDKRVRKSESVNVIKDVTGKSTCRGTIEDFINYFNSRYEKISKIFRGRLTQIPIGSVWKVKSEKVDVVGIVGNVKEISDDKAIFELEDKTGKINVTATGKLKEVAMELLGDEIIGVSGSLMGRGIIADRIIFPDVPVNDKKLKKDFRIVFISDTHFGSKTFLKDEWNSFLKWINCEVGDNRVIEIAESVKYLIICGDLVDGIGIYPEQDKEIEILDINQQYEFSAEQLDLIRKDIKIILSPGNHDAVRQAEPQPALPKEFSSLFPKNVKCVGNPCFVDLEGVKVLIYHGRSLDDVVSRIKRLNYSNPHEAMIELLKRRHLSPMYGNRSPIAPENDDYLVIDEVPDILHSGHVHTYGTAFYRGVFVVNSSTWQSQTEFQKKVNLNPQPGNVAVYNPGGDVIRLRFYSG